MANKKSQEKKGLKYELSQKNGKSLKATKSATKATSKSDVKGKNKGGKEKVGKGKGGKDKSGKDKEGKDKSKKDKDKDEEEEGAEEGGSIMYFAIGGVFLLVAVGAVVFMSMGAGPPIKSAAKGLGLNVGTKITHLSQTGGVEYLVLEDVPEYRETLLREFDSVSIDTCSQMFHIHKAAVAPQDQYDYSDCKYMLDFAKKNQLKARVSSLVWLKPDKYPDFVSILSNQGREDYLLKYVNDVVRELGETVRAWDVVNEALSDSANEGAFLWTSHIDNTQISGVICKLFKAARTARDAVNPDMKLVYNDYGIYSINSAMHNNKSGRAYQLVDSLVNNDCGIDAVGFQMHVDRHFTEFDMIRQNMQRYAGIGIEVHITELDVSCGGLGDDSIACDLTGNQTWTVDMEKAQSNVYGGILRACLSEPNCDTFHMYDLADGYDTWDEIQEPENPFIFTNNFKKKPAYAGVRDVLRDHSRDDLAVKARLSGSWHPDYVAPIANSNSTTTD